MSADRTPLPRRAAHRRPARRHADVLVVGLGRFGSAVAESLVRQGVDVLAIDENPDRVQRFAEDFTHTVQADATDGEAMRQLGIGDLDAAVVAIGSDIEASVLAVITLVEAGVPEIFAKAITRKHGKILTSIGAHHVIYPELIMGQRVAHMVTGGLQDYLELDDGFAVARSAAPPQTWDQDLATSALRTRHRITVVGVRRAAGGFVHAAPDTVVHAGDDLVLAGRTEDVERFTALTRGVRQDRDR
ncbi:potassium channel family protein [Ornithinimicrobium sp. CNJ-824]|uniref:potassium channel family protein n=1 Tax=Ornithinimicrobium sp. CNJ-824 TaxID=1904966 RepID=UPI001EDA73AF|nr:TrkA family potassium uptake protein [Ornithinimicrobium sp. CNJ-824]